MEGKSKPAPLQTKGCGTPASIYQASYPNDILSPRTSRKNIFIKQKDFVGHPPSLWSDWP
jgi:hypothetical protein